MMKTIAIQASLFVLITAGCAVAQTKPSTLSAEPVDQATSQSSSIDQVLDALDVRGKELKDFTAKVKLTDTDEAEGTQSILSGRIWMQRLSADDARLHVLFDRKVNNDKSEAYRTEYLLSNGTLIDRDYPARREVDRQILRPGQKIDLLKLGEGPFPLPLGQDKASVHRMFEVKKFDAAKGDPPGTIHLQLKPKPGTQFEQKFSTIDFWVDPKTRMPIRIVTEDPNGTTQKTTDLTDIRVNAGLGDSDFKLDKVDEKTWNIIQEPYDQ